MKEGRVRMLGSVMALSRWILSIVLEIVIVIYSVDESDRGL